MTLDEIRTLYALVVSYDNRRLSEANLHAWWEQAERQRWTLTEASEAVRVHFGRSTDFLMPAHVTAIVRARRADPRPVADSRQLPAAQPASPQRIRAIVDEIRALLPEPTTHARALMRARAERGRATVEPSRSESGQRRRRRRYSKPQASAVAALARRYLADGYSPQDVSERLGIAKRWCYRNAPRTSYEQEI